jgi:hypothetical protein
MKARFCAVLVALFSLACTGGGSGGNDDADVDIAWGCDGNASATDWLFYVEVTQTGGAEITDDELVCDVRQGGEFLETMYPQRQGGRWYAEAWEDDIGVDCDRFDGITVGCDGFDAQ